MTVSEELHIEKVLLCFCHIIIEKQRDQHFRQIITSNCPFKGKLVGSVVRVDDPNYYSSQTVFKFISLPYSFIEVKISEQFTQYKYILTNSMAFLLFSISFLCFQG